MKQKKGFVDFKKLKQAVSIKQILEHYKLLEDLAGEGDSLSGYCPICEGESDTLFRVSLSKNCWNCFGDCSGGNILDLVSQMEDCTIRQAGLEISAWFKLGSSSPKKKSTLRKRASKRQDKQKNEDTDKVKINENKPLGFVLELDANHDSLDALGLSSEAVEDYGIGYCAKGFLKGKVAFPVHNVEGNVVAYGGIHLDSEDLQYPNFSYPDKAKFNPTLEMFGLYHAIQRGSTEVIYMVKSPLEVFHAWQHDEISAVCFLAHPQSDALGTNMRKLWHDCLLD